MEAGEEEDVQGRLGDKHSFVSFVAQFTTLKSLDYTDFMTFRFNHRQRCSTAVVRLMHE